jgi:2-polyprenyl-6-methoxyphenol hydroxylase-like FAD-dependent oxidoreductase
MASIGIIGAGTAGLHLGLKLQAHGVPVTLYTEREPGALASGRLPNTAAHHGVMRGRERELGVDHWGGPQTDMYRMGVHVNGPQSFGMQGYLRVPGLFVDYRLYQPRLAEDFMARGGRVEVVPVDAVTLDRLSRLHDLVVVATGRNGLTSLFPRIPELSPHTQPARRLFCAILKGLRMKESRGMEAQLVPGQGEIFEAQFISRHGRTPSMLFEAIPGSELEALSTQRYDDDPRAFDALLLDRVRRFAPATYERVDPEHFGVMEPLDMMQGAFTPVVRRPWAPLGEGRFVVAVGDTHVTMDPVAGQGANAASASAFALAGCILDALGAERPFDEAFCRDAEAKSWAASAPMNDWTNALLQPPPPHVVELLIAGSQEQGVADAIVNAFVNPEQMLAATATPENTAAFIAHHRAPRTAAN